MTINEAIELAINGEAVLFIGSGFSVGAINLIDEKMQTGTVLAKTLCKILGLSEEEANTTPLSVASEAYLSTYGADKLIELLKKLYTVKSISDYHKEMVSISWKRIYTTNYDNIIEVACAQSSKQVNSITIKDEIEHFDSKSLLYLHINGYINNLNRETLLTNFKLTDQSYWAEDFKNNKWSNFFRTDLNKAKAVFFIGYSLYDLDIARILFETKGLQEKTFFIIGNNPNKLLRERCEKFGNIELSNTEEFTKKLSSIKQDYIPKKCSDMLLDSFEEVVLETIPTTLNDRRIFELFVYGKIDRSLIQKDIQEKTQNYFIYRDGIDEIFKAIDNDLKYFVIDSELGGGKTLFVEGIAAKALVEGFRVFNLMFIKDGIYEEIEYIAKLNVKKIILIESYPQYLLYIKDFINFKNDKTILIFTARTYIKDVTFDRLRSGLSSSKIYELTLDRLNDKEINALVIFLEKYGLTGRYLASKGENAKKKYIQDTCKSSLKLILIDIIKSYAIDGELKKIIDNITHEQSYFQAILTIFILQIIEVEADIEIVVDLIGDRNLYGHDFKHDVNILELVDFNSDRVSAKSSILAQYILSTANNIKAILRTLITTYKNAEKYAYNKNIFSNISYNLTLYRNLSEILPVGTNTATSKNQEKAIVEFYENVKNYERNKSNPHFWLQYAISKLFMKDFEMSKQYFDTAYGLAQGKNQYDTMMLDNHYARYLLEYVIYYNDKVQSMANFKLANEILIKQISDKDNKSRFYPYRVVHNYKEFSELFFNDLGENDKKFFIKACKNILHYINNIDSELRLNKYLAQAKDDLLHITSTYGVKDMRKL